MDRLCEIFVQFEPVLNVKNRAPRYTSIAVARTFFMVGNSTWMGPLGMDICVSVALGYDDGAIR